MKDGSVARFVLNVVVFELTNDGELICNYVDPLNIKSRMKYEI